MERIAYETFKLNTEFYLITNYKYQKCFLDDKLAHARCVVVRYGQTVTEGQKNHLEISGSETIESMCDLVPFLFIFMYVVSQKYIVNPAAEIKKIQKMSIRNNFSKIH